MKEEPDNKCKGLGFSHSWQNTTSGWVTASIPPQYPPHQDTCVNCGLIRIERINKWYEYKIN